MKSVKKMLLGFAFLLIALMGAIIYEGDFAYVLFIIGAPLGLVFCILGCYDEEIKPLINKMENKENGNKDLK